MSLFTIPYEKPESRSQMLRYRIDRLTVIRMLTIKRFYTGAAELTSLFEELINNEIKPFQFFFANITCLSIHNAIVMSLI